MEEGTDRAGELPSFLPDTVCTSFGNSQSSLFTTSLIHFPIHSCIHFFIHSPISMARRHQLNKCYCLSSPYLYISTPSDLLEMRNTPAFEHFYIFLPLLLCNCWWVASAFSTFTSFSSSAYHSFLYQNASQSTKSTQSLKIIYINQKF